ncbi:hypothetical protein [Devosia sp.]|uniref:hypothetical protein n=1 Tax=Devosia sp. TaxID=1871048 RepID=UPI003A8CF2A4
MTPKTLGRIAGILGLTAILAGCIDVTAEVEVLSETEGRGVSTITMSSDFYPMLKSMGAQGSDPDDGFCDEAGAVLTETEDGGATCTIEASGKLADVNKEGPNENAAFTVVSPGVVRVAFKTEGMAGQVTEGQDAESAAMVMPYFEGHDVTIVVKGKAITDTNMTLSEDKTSAKYVIPFTDLLQGTAKLPDELYAVVDTN